MDGSYRKEVEAQLRVRCVHLETKEAFVGLPAEHEQAFAADDAILWCDQTGEALGPDGNAAEMEGCHGECPRACYQPPLRPSVS